MTTLTHTKASAAELKRITRERTGGPHSEGQPEVVAAHSDHASLRTPYGSHMPLDTTIHWNWRNPLNILPAFMIVLFVLSVAGLLMR